MSQREPRRPRYVDHDGFLMPMGFPVEGFDSGLGYRAAPGDIFVATYPKCGTTWMQYILWLLVNDARPLGPGEALTELFPHLEEVGAEAVRALPEPRLIKTHLPSSMVPWSPDAKYVWVARNPFDCAVSFFHHTRGFVRHYDFADGTFADFFECFIAGKVDFGDYFDHLLSWYARKDEPNVRFVTYEAMHQDARRAVVEVAKFVGGRAAATARDDACVQRILAETSFDSMRRDQRRWSSERPPGMPEFVRKGGVGDWKSCFSPEQAARLIEAFERRTAGTGAATLWPEILADVRRYARSADSARGPYDRRT